MALATAVKPCLVRIKLEDGREDVVPVSGGFVEVLPDKITLLADTAELRRYRSGARPIGEGARRKAPGSKRRRGGSGACSRRPGTRQPASGSHR
ncbi:hypothetical protein GCM10025858_20630 [Alicyclobacillus sacchari]|nr:hypothetical protein GCM10025858_20630 [Alicyclobacillus sacchari]